MPWKTHFHLLHSLGEILVTAEERFNLLLQTLDLMLMSPRLSLVKLLARLASFLDFCDPRFKPPYIRLVLILDRLEEGSKVADVVVLDCIDILTQADNSSHHLDVLLRHGPLNLCSYGVFDLRPHLGLKLLP